MKVVGVVLALLGALLSFVLWRTPSTVSERPLRRHLRAPLAGASVGVLVLVVATVHAWRG